MDLNDVKAVARQGEGLRLEFKKKANYPEKIVKELVAFANTDGGTLLLGVDDDGTASGVRSIEGELFLVEEAIKNLIRPRLSYTTEIIRVNEKKGIAVLNIEAAQGKAFAVKDDPNKKYGVAYVRKKDESLQASKEMREIIERRYKKKDIQFTYDEKVKTAICLAEEQGSVTISQFVEAAKISKFIASRVLIRLVLANVMDIVPMPLNDEYILKT